MTVFYVTACKRFNSMCRMGRMSNPVNMGMGTEAPLYAVQSVEKQCLRPSQDDVFVSLCATPVMRLTALYQQAYIVIMHQSLQERAELSTGHFSCTRPDPAKR